MPDLLAELIKRAGRNPAIQRALRSDGIVEGDEPYIDQFLGKENLFPTDERPSHLNITDRLPWYRPTKPPRFVAEYVNDELPGMSGMKRPVTDSEIQSLSPGNIIELGYGNFPGYGHAKLSIGKDNRGPYASLYDKYDFESPVIHPVVSRIMSMVGKPYHVYSKQRLYKRPDGTYETMVPHDIELPVGDR